MKYHSNIKEKENINWKDEVPVRVHNSLYNSFGEDFNLNNKQLRDKVMQSTWIKRTPNFGKKSWEYLINYIKYRWPEDNYGEAAKDFKLLPRNLSIGHEKRNLQIWNDRQSNMTYSAIGKKHNLSQERVRQILCRIDRNKEFLLPLYRQFK